MNKICKICIDEHIFSLISGAENVDWTSDSQYLNEIAEYDVQEIINCLLSHPKIEVKQKSDDVYEIKLLYRNENRFVEINFTTFDGENDSAWGGSNLTGECFYSDVLEIWSYLKKQFPCVWLHDKNCTIYSEEAFKSKFK